MLSGIVSRETILFLIVSGIAVVGWMNAFMEARENKDLHAQIRALTKLTHAYRTARKSDQPKGQANVD